MALNKGNLGFTTTVSGLTTSSVYTVGSAQTAYIKSILIHNANTAGIHTVRLHMVRNSGGSAGTAGTTTQIARLGIAQNDSFFFEPAYPITLTSNGDSIQLYNEGAQVINVLVLGDKEV